MADGGGGGVYKQYSVISIVVNRSTDRGEAKQLRRRNCRGRGEFWVSGKFFCLFLEPQEVLLEIMPRNVF